MCYANDLFLPKNNFKIKCVFDAISVLGFIFFKKEKFIPKKGRQYDQKHFLTIYTEGVGVMVTGVLANDILVNGCPLPVTNTSLTNHHRNKVA